jgi:hypothetical protein
MRLVGLACLIVLLAACPLNAGRLPSDAFTEVATTSWPYRVMDGLQQRGLFAGYPEGVFSGRRTLTRYEFAVGVHRMLGDAQRWLREWNPEHVPLRAPSADTPEGAVFRAIIRKYRVESPRWKDGEDLARLVAEFAPELRALGLAVERIHPETVASVEGDVQVPARPADETPPQRAGRARARREWRSGAVYVDCPGCTAFGTDALLGVPLRARPFPGSDQVSEIDAYNDEVCRLTLERGWPPNSRRRAGKRPGRSAVEGAASGRAESPGARRAAEGLRASRRRPEEPTPGWE